MDLPRRPARWDEIKEWLFALDEAELLYVRRWIVRYVNRWGQIPFLASYQHSKANERGSAPRVDRDEP
jgi:hypothetical protein